ncbi:MAG: 30S ribosomal protein S4 [Rhodothermaceae bacterium]|nr:30S ribosomal protein S4 [Bacteroidota bacterium]MXW15008.1 30S ribosomal protein S4 [Rhodothermaceae bacterium]MDE2646113.1 30S ribosomal protein S4 [Bacteroidota bacterium]MXW32681.1 30S ribosomal protein S4 [Rhodothermaceae bacterium]MXX97130.1 30S ribosomal protein S4 [Rhodothermaceae bacterium]
MARYRGPKQKIARRFNEPLFGPSKSLERKPNPPGQHGQKRRRRESEYAVQLKEKQKAKHIYGVLERQFKNLFEKAARKKGVTGENLLRFLEARLDNTVFRFGFGSTRRQARQMVTHGHILVNGQVVDIPSYQLRPGDIVSVRPRSRQNPIFIENVKKNRRVFSWLETDRRVLSGKFLDFPERSDIPENIREQLIVELYSK